MIKRCVEVGSGPTHLALKNGQMIITREGEEVGTVPIEDLGVLVLAHRAITVTLMLMSHLAKANVAVVFCGEDHHPVGLLLPMEGNIVHAKVLAAQARVKDKVKDGLWQTLVTAKVENQARVLDWLNLDGDPIRGVLRFQADKAPAVQEAQASQRYWPRLFGKSFRRRREGPPPNNMLNYGYAILRATVARALVAAGLHPALGLHHRNQYNAFALADDVMEPFRPLVDLAVHGLMRKTNGELNGLAKKELLGLVASPVHWKGMNSPFMVALQRTAASLRDVLSGEAREVELPEAFAPSRR